MYGLSKTSLPICSTVPETATFLFLNFSSAETSFALYSCAKSDAEISKSTTIKYGLSE